MAGALAKHGKTNGSANPESGSASFVRDTVTKTGRGKSTIEEDVSIGTKLTPAAPLDRKGIEAR